MSYQDGVYVSRGNKPVPPDERFWFRVNKSGANGCWTWTGCIQANGYGRLGGEPGEILSAHRFSYELNVGPIPPGLVIDHLCRNRSCVNPDHLEPVLNRVNVHRGYLAIRAERGNNCKHGHELTEENSYFSPGRPTQIQCKTCRLMANRRYLARRAGKGAAA